MEDKNNIGRFVLILSIATTLFALVKFLLPKYGVIINALYYFTPLLAVSVAEKSGILTVFRRYGAGVRKACFRKSLCYVIVIALAFPVLNILCIWFFGNVLHVESFGIFSIPKDDFMLYGIRMPENPVLRFASVYLSSVFFALIAGLTYNMIFALGSEIAWRGFLHRKIRLGCSMKNILIGAIWATWWLPVMIFNGYACPSIATAYVSFVLLSFLLDRIFMDTRSLLVTSAVRGVIVSSYGILVAGGNPLFHGTNGLAGMISLFVIASGVCIFRSSAAADQDRRNMPVS